jgi:molybdenum cofactor cytidylyltransferase
VIAWGLGVLRTALILAAGLSTRFPGNKLLHVVEDRVVGRDSIVRVVTRKFLGCECFDEVVVVVGYEFAKVIEVLKDLDVKFVYNPNFTGGMSTSVIAGARRVVKHSSLVAVHPADVPFIRTSTIALLVSTALEYTTSGGAIVIPRYGGRGGHPLVVSGELVRELLNLSEGELGLKGLISRRRNRVVYVDVDDPGAVLDIDRPEDLDAAYRTLLGASRSFQNS